MKSLDVTWSRCKSEFDWDGSLRDIYVLDTSSKDWAVLLAEIPLWGYKVSGDSEGKTCPIPVSFDEVRKITEVASLVLSINLVGILVNTHFYHDAFIEFDIDPREINSQDDLDKLLEFIQRIGRNLGRRVILTPENDIETPILDFDPVSNRFVYIPYE